jgi:hypothetical protein
MAGATLALWDEVLKTFYLPAIQEQLNQDTLLSNIIDVNETDVSGKNAMIECHYGRNTGTGARADSGALPTAGYQKFKTATVPMKYNYGRVQFTGPTIAATRDEKGSYARVVDKEITGVVTDLKKEVNRQLWGCGYGTLARWRDGSSTTYTLQKLYRGNSAGGDGFGSAFGAKYLTENNSGVVVVATSYGSASNGTYTVDATDISVSAVTEGTDYDTITITNPSVTEAAGLFIVRGDANAQSLGAAAASGTQRLEMMGLRGIVTDTDLDDIACTTDGETTCSLKTAFSDSLQGLAVGSYTWWKALVSHHGSGRYAGQRALTMTMMQQMFDAVEKKAGKDYGPNLILTTRAIRREYLELATADRRYVNTMTLDGGFSALDYNGVPLTVDDDAIDGEMYFLTTKDLQLYRMSDYDWMSKDGAILSRVSGYDAYEAILFRYAELGCVRRNTQGVLCDLSYTADI